MTRASLPAAYFESLYAGDPDPWRFASSPYERNKYADTLAALAPRYRRGFEVGCSIGVLTASLAARCDALLAVDIAAGAVQAARQRCADLPQVTLARMTVPGTWPDGAFDLIVLSEVLYYLSPDDLARVASLVAGSMAPGGDCILVHWTGETDYPLPGDEAVADFLAALPSGFRVSRQERRPAYRMDVLRRQPAP